MTDIIGKDADRRFRRRYVASLLFGVLVLVAFVGAGGGWAVTAQLSGAVVASGVVAPEGERRTIQHLEGGIVDRILVKEGDRVAEGQPLLVLRKVFAEAEADRLRTRLDHLVAIEARLRAERVGSGTMDLSFLGDTGEGGLPELVQQQLEHLASRRESDENQKAILREQIAQLKERIAGTQRQISAVTRQYDLIGYELADVRTLVEKGLARRPRLLELERAAADLQGRLGELEASVAEAGGAMNEIRMAILDIDKRRREEVEEQLSDIQAQRLDIEQQLREGEDRLERTIIAAPLAGVVHDLKVTTISGVIRPGEPLLDIVPEGDALIVNGRVRPIDVDDVYIGQEALVVFPSFPQRTAPRLYGAVVKLSPDTLVDDVTKQPYFAVEIEVPPENLGTAGNHIALQPGIPAEVFLSTGARTLAEYLGQPITETFERSLREP